MTTGPLKGKCHITTTLLHTDSYIYFSLRDALRTTSNILNTDISSQVYQYSCLLLDTDYSFDYIRFNLWLAIVATDCTVVYYQVDEPNSMFPQDMAILHEREKD
jgi:hypothetical protein